MHSRFSASLSKKDKEAIRRGVQATEEGKVILADTFFEWMRAKYVRDIWDARMEEEKVKLKTLEKWVLEQLNDPNHDERYLIAMRGVLRTIRRDL